MGSRFQFSDCVQPSSLESVTPSNTANGTQSSAINNDTRDCEAPFFFVNVSTLANNKNLTLAVEDSDTTTSGDYEEATYPASQEVSVSANGVYKLYYAGKKRYCRVKVTSVEANPAATISIQFVKASLHEKPDNNSFN